MAEKKTETAVEKIYTIPLRKHWRPGPRISRTKKSVSAVKEFVARHTRSGDIRISEKVNSLLWKGGAKKPLHKIRVKVNLIEGRASVRLPEEITLEEEKKKFLEEREKKKAEEKAAAAEKKGAETAPPAAEEKPKEGAKEEAAGPKEERPPEDKGEEKEGPSEKKS
jgi:large subunit ribosomal protein L31e